MENLEFYWENAKEKEMSIDVPGFSKSEIKVSLAGNSMTIRAHKKRHDAEHGKHYYKEESVSHSFTKSLSFPKRINPRDFEVKIRDGLVVIKKKAK